MTNSQAAQLALYVLYAEDAFQSDPLTLTPSQDPRLKGWSVIGYLTAVDHLFADGDTVYYGYVAQSTTDPTQYLAAIRGTATMAEWAEDGDFLLTPHPVAGKVEAGFWGVYASLTYRPVGSAEALPAAQGLTRQIGTGHLQIAGHSLGSALATYLAFDMPPSQIDATMFASPRPGNAAFTAAFHARVANYQVFNYRLDVVPHIPIGFDYAQLPAASWITPDDAQARIRFSLLCDHHLLSHAAMLDYTLMDWQDFPVFDQPFCECIRGPR